MARQFFNLAEVMGQVDQSRVRDQQIKANEFAMQNQQRQYERQMRQDADLDAQKGIYRGAIETVDGNAALNEKKLIEGMLQQNPEMALKLQQQFQDRDINAGKLQRDNQMGELELKNKKASFYRDALATATPETYPSIIQQAQQDGMAFANNAPLQFDPAFIKQNVMTADKFLESLKPKAPTTRTVRMGTDTVTQQFNEQTGQFEEVGRGSAFAPKEPTLPSGYTTNPDGGLMPIKGGPADPSTKANKTAKITEGERKAATLLKRLEFSENQLSNVTTSNKDAQKPGLLQNGLRSFGMDSAANYLTSGDRQKVEAAQLDILDAALTLGTGAAYTREQLEGYRNSYFPQIGDNEGTIADKADRLKNVIDAAKIAAGNAAPSAELEQPNQRVNIMPAGEKMQANGYNGKAPPKDFPKARRAPDGFWYLKNANGKYQKVIQ